MPGGFAIGLLERLIPRDSLARRLVRRLLPAFFILVAIDLLATWVMTDVIRPQPWLLRDLFWMMLLTQGLLVVLFAWVLISGIRIELASINRLADQIRQRSIEDLQPLDTAGIPGEIAPLVHHFNDLLVRLDDSVQAQRRFVGHAAHQLRTPLAGLKLESELMLGQDLADDIRMRAGRIKSVTDHMIRMGQQLLVLARADHALRPQDSFVRLDLCEWMRQAGSEWLDRAHAQAIDLQLTAPGQPVWVDADPVLLGELLGNLIDNALRYGRGAQEIQLRVISNPPSFSVEDDGAGIRADEIERVFDAFYRAADAGPGGAGLGLAIVREIARAHGAWWKVISRPTFDGTRITLVFPGPRRGACLTRVE
ncbi:sensor histidine kinase [Castellaniella sp.]|uniref:sensor histidine kinase n=1 Tax=Castellaniella sp. TaxID=1955812 RepID=UPI002AFFD330|nr:ATP-binding protein [Castellaniella sp.]